MEQPKTNNPLFEQYNLPISRNYEGRAEEINEFISKAEGMTKGQIDERIAALKQARADFEQKIVELEGNSEKTDMKAGFQKNVASISDELDILKHFPKK